MISARVFICLFYFVSEAHLLVTLVSISVAIIRLHTNVSMYIKVAFIRMIKLNMPVLGKFGVELIATQFVFIQIESTHTH